MGNRGHNVLNKLAGKRLIELLDYRDQPNVVFFEHHLDRRIIRDVAAHAIKFVHQDNIDLAVGLCPVKHFLKLWTFDGAS
ncbi:MAG: hypothetical protein COT81_00435 [Candidatus Buchananbacteria bacterium CG10_big_fil_rev_8_21_14_0_10_42_9]|uniref:Uncharacterized protein n=1 Tax=Candidatus Buchananbacteria bacterium CG10_big_fil_rev_8_21_14_0_10_42_9 TaxID=1974526 RepID=A0A2H0W2F1_9BACT|nr:MAG: hypothetical protein COT81_00435 [Candidatus Buchananbacteria bacterium CG10_big_fil_rev_8_21_14_0_10_42_9]